MSISTIYVFVERTPYSGGLILEQDSDTCTWTWRTMRAANAIPIGWNGAGPVEDAVESGGAERNTNTVRCLESGRGAAIALYGFGGSVYVVGGWSTRMTGVSGRGYLFQSANSAFRGDIQWRFIEHP